MNRKRCSFYPMEFLESRTLLTVFTVTNTNDSGVGSLRWALTEANSTPGVDTIAFNIASANKTIQPTSGLPALMDPTVINGMTQPGYAGKPLVRIDGSMAGSTEGGIELYGGCTLEGLDITGFDGQAVTTIPNSITGQGANLIRDNWIGVDLTGSPAANSSNDLGIYSPRNVIEGNVLGSSGGDGIWMMGDIFNNTNGNNLIEGNLIGLDPTGRHARGELDGIGIQNSPDDAVLGNIIAGSSQDGILLQGTASGAVIQGNWIGTDKTGTVAVGNGLYGIEDQSDHGLIGGLRARDRNIISASGSAGIVFWLSGSHDNVVEGNYIGTDVTGEHAMGNAEQGIAFSQAGANLVGGTTAAARNLISGNKQEGVGIFPASGETIEGNWIGLDALGQPMGNGTWGVTCLAGSTNCVIEQNTIINNPSGPIFLEAGDGTFTGNITVLRSKRRSA